MAKPKKKFKKKIKQFPDASSSMVALDGFNGDLKKMVRQWQKDYFHKYFERIDWKAVRKQYPGGDGAAGGFTGPPPWPR